MSQHLLLQGDQKDLWKITGTAIYLPHHHELWIYMVVRRETPLYHTNRELVTLNEEWQHTFILTPTECREMLKLTKKK